MLAVLELIAGDPVEHVQHLARPGVGSDEVHEAADLAQDLRSELVALVIADLAQHALDLRAARPADRCEHERQHGDLDVR